MNEHEIHDRLFSRACDGLATAEENVELHRLLRTDAAALDDWLHYSALHGELAGGTALANMLASQPSVGLDNVVPMPRRKWHSLAAAAAAGLVLGLFGATMVLAFVRPHVGKVIPLLHESFESPSVPLRTRVPLEPGLWRGDLSQIVGEQDGVKPASGGRMLRFLRAGYAGKPKVEGNHLADVYQLIDLRPHRSELSDGEAVVEVSAKFNAAPFPSGESYGCAISVYALDTETAPSGPSRIGNALTADALAMARSPRARLDRDPATWQRLDTELRLPANTEFIVIRLHITQAYDSPGKSAFTGSYADDVTVSLLRRAPVL